MQPYTTRPLTPYRTLTDQEIASSRGDTLFVDVEAYSNLFYAAFLHESGYIEFELSPSTSFDRNKLAWVLANYRTVGFNSLPFDIPVIAWALDNPDTASIKSAVQRLISGERHDWLTPKIDHIDILPVAPLTGSLKLYGARLHSPRLQDLPFDPERPLGQPEAELVKDYCRAADLPTTKLIWDNLAEQIKLREELSREYGLDLRSKSDAQIAEALIKSELRKRTRQPIKRPTVVAREWAYEAPAWLQFKTPELQAAFEVVKAGRYSLDDEEKIVAPPQVKALQIWLGPTRFQMGKGGLHSCEKTVAYRATDDMMIVDRDVRAYYPRIILNNNFFPRHLPSELAEIYRHSVESRDEDKLAKRYARAEGKKIVNNGYSGKMKSKWSVFYAPDQYINMTLTGQFGLLMEAELLTLEGFEVVSGNTDGIVTKVPTKRHDEFCSLIEAWEKETGFTTEETLYSSLFAKDCNNYIAIKTDSEIKGKGEYTDPWSGGEKTAIFRFHKNPTAQICTEAAIAWIVDKRPLMETIAHCNDFTRFVIARNVKGGASFKGKSLGKTVRWAWTVDGDTIRYVGSNNKVAQSDGCTPFMDMPTEMPSGLDLKRYEKEAEKILYEISAKRRLTLFDMICDKDDVE